MGPIWGRQDPGGPYVGPMNYSIFFFQNSPKASNQKTIVCPNERAAITVVLCEKNQNGTATEMVVDVKRKFKS